MNINKMTVFCGSNSGNNLLYQQQAVALGKLLAQNGIEMIYGGGKKGLMGIVADSSMEEGGIVRGVIPEILVKWETQHDSLTELLIVEDMHQRKRKLYEWCDAAIILPGGFGTLDELFEILTWNQLIIHDKKIFLLNTAGFYNHLLQHLQLLEDEGFLYGRLHEKFTILQEPNELLSYL